LTNYKNIYRVYYFQKLSKKISRIPCAYRNEKSAEKRLLPDRDDIFITGLVSLALTVS